MQRLIVLIITYKKFRRFYLILVKVDKLPERLMIRKNQLALNFIAINNNNKKKIKITKEDKTISRLSFPRPPLETRIKMPQKVAREDTATGFTRRCIECYRQLLREVFLKVDFRRARELRDNVSHSYFIL